MGCDRWTERNEGEARDRGLDGQAGGWRELALTVPISGERDPRAVVQARILTWGVGKAEHGTAGHEGPGGGLETAVRGSRARLAAPVTRR